MEKTKFPWTVFLMALAVGFSSWVYFGVYSTEENREKLKTEAAAVLPFSNSTVVEVRISDRSVPASETWLKKEGEVWRILKPYEDLAELTTVDGFLATLSAEKIQETVKEGPGIDWKVYGLSEPLVQATITTNASPPAHERKIQIGTVKAFDGSLYARFDQNERVVLVSSTLQAALQREPRDFRDKHFFAGSSLPNFKSLSVSRPGQPALLLKKDGDLWVEASPLPSSKMNIWPLDQQQVKSFIDAITGIRGSDVWGDDKTDVKVLRLRKLEQPAYELILKTEKNESFGAKFAKLGVNESLSAGVSSLRPLVFSVYKGQIELLNKSIDELRDLNFPFQFKIADVKRIELERARGSVSLPTLEKVSEKWTLVAPNQEFVGRDVLSDRVDKLLTSLNGLSAKRILPKAKPLSKRLAKGAVRATLFDSSGKQVSEFIFQSVVSGDTSAEQAVQATSGLIPGKVFEIDRILFDGLEFDVLTPPQEKSAK